jgi:hypothetical protein
VTAVVPTASQSDIVRDLLSEHGTTYAEDAGITLRDKPAPLYQLLVLTTLASTRISAAIAAAVVNGVVTPTVREGTATARSHGSHLDQSRNGS